MAVTATQQRTGMRLAFGVLAAGGTSIVPITPPVSHFVELLELLHTLALLDLYSAGS